MNSMDEIIRRQVELALIEDIGPGDLTTRACIESQSIEAEIIGKSEGVVAGLPLVEATFKHLDSELKVTILKKDGSSFKSGDNIVTIKGDSRAILTGERTALNFLGHLSGIATLTNRFVKMIEGTKAKILDTRKTIPGLRYLEKYAVSCGGGENHRFGLYDMALIKDNHIAACGSISKAFEKMRQYINSAEYKKCFAAEVKKVAIEVEVTSLKELIEAIESGAKRLLLDNQSVERLAAMVQKARAINPAVALEASGNVNVANVRSIAETGVDYISIGLLTHSAPSSDFSLKVISNDG